MLIVVDSVFFVVHNRGFYKIIEKPHTFDSESYCYIKTPMSGCLLVLNNFVFGDFFIEFGWSCGIYI